MITIRHTPDTQAAYEQIFRGGAIHQMDSFFIWISTHLKIRKNLILLDIATGRGQMVEYARKAGAIAFGIDFSMTACHRASDRVPDHISNADAHLLPFSDDTFDIITNIGSLEHFERMDQALRETARVVKPSGTVCFSVPNTFGLRWNVQIAWRTGDIDDDGQPIQRYGTRRQWEQLFKDNGLIVESVSGYEHERAFPRTSRDLLNYLKHPKRMISMLLIVPFIPVNMAGQFVFICRPTKSNRM